MLPTSHLVPMNEMPLARASTDEALLLADAFSDFIAASAKLEGSYRDLQIEVAQLGSELADRNAELEASLRSNEQMRLALVEIVDSMPCGVLVLGEDARVLRMNPEAKRLLALPGAPGSRKQAAGDPADPADLDEIAARTGVDLNPFCAIEGESEISFPLSGTGAAGRRWIELRTRRLTAEPGGAKAILILGDISAHKQAEQDREAGRRALALAEVAATLAHEIRNPLASLELFAGLLEEEPARSAEWLTHLRAGLRGLAGTVNNVLSFHGVGFPHMRPLELGKALAAATEFVRPITGQAGLVLSFGGGGLEGRVLANEAALQQLLLNLVTNAVRHTPSGGSIAVSLTQTDAAHLRVEVSDTGCGIAPEHLPHIFRAGWSASGASSGLGLAVCQRIAAQHGTELRVASEPGRGTTFQMELNLL